MSALEKRTAIRDRNERLLIANICAKREELNELLAEAHSHWGYEDPIYRFYHQSFKVFFLQATTERIVQQLRELLPDCELNPWFLEIISSGTRKDFDLSMNENWLTETRPMLEAFFHAKYFLEMVCRYSEQLDSPPSVLPSGWASVLYLFGLR